MLNTQQVVVVLGDEFDDALRVKLIDVLKQLGVTSTSYGRFLAGSQDFEELDVNLNGVSLRIEAETYVGLSIQGPSDVVEKVRELVSQS